jgi:hypothetical protein
VGKGALGAVPTTHIAILKWWARFALPTLRDPRNDENMTARPNPSDIAEVAFFRSIVPELIEPEKQ